MKIIGIGHDSYRGYGGELIQAEEEAMVADNRGKDKVVKTRRSVGYIRVSSSAQVLDDSLEEQRELISARLRAGSWWSPTRTAGSRARRGRASSE